MYALMIQAMGVWICLKKWIQQEKEGVNTFKSIFRIGVWTTIVYSTLYGALCYLFNSLAATDLLNETVNELLYNLEQMEGLIGEKQQTMYAQIYGSINFSILCFSEVFTKFMTGMIISLVLALVFKQKNVGA